MAKIRVATWNLEWAEPNSERGRVCEARLRELNADIVCLTEAFENTLQSFAGYSASANPDAGYPIRAGRRKVVIWSRWPLENIDEVGSADLPTGRFVSAFIRGLSSLVVMGVCIPWKAAHVNDGGKDRDWWEDHRRYLSALNKVDRFNNTNLPTIVLGDFNQRLSGKYTRNDVHEMLKQTFDQFTIPTGDLQDTDGKSAIDHIAIRGDIEIGESGVISRFDPNGVELSDHFGVWCDITFK